MHRILIVVSLIVVALAGLIAAGRTANTAAQAGTPVVGTPTAGAEVNQAVVRRWFEEGWNQADEAAIQALIAPEHTFDVPGLPPLPPGPEGYLLLVPAFHQGFPDLHYEVGAMLAEGDEVAVEWTFRGTHTGAFQGLPPTGNQVEVRGISIYRITNGQIVQSRAVFDTLTFAQQIGAIPAPVGTPAP